jgi:hypothetical protein
MASVITGIRSVGFSSLIGIIAACTVEICPPK